MTLTEVLENFEAVIVFDVLDNLLLTMEYTGIPERRSEGI
jgi:hypothetical protein